ncbi:hypothetical protein, partial [Pseudoalteromonas sp. SIMBA_162]|uniref:hypothetical protein n=1 Tax=Pseudoalteromonas sp. SIMBA_162 TaxID=3080867 RepID=UPI0039787303
MAVGGLIINQCLPEPASQGAGKSLSATHEPQADWVATWREQQRHWAARLEEAFADRPRLRLLRQPELPEDRASLAPLVAQFT